MTPIHDPWGVLDLRPGAPHDEILKAYLRLRRALRADSPALLSLECEAARRAELEAIEEAYRSLSRNAAVPLRPDPPPAPATGARPVSRPARHVGPRRSSVPLDRVITRPTIRI
jgi:curved DNA-binding protein CbpA